MPPGWHDWAVFVGPEYFDYGLASKGAVRHFGVSESEYSTDVLTQAAVGFVRAADHRPFFLCYGPYAPHAPATPAPRHAGRFATLAPWRPPSFDEVDVGDKPPFFEANVPPLGENEVTELDALRQRMLESLLAVDDGVAAIMEALRETGRERDTIVVFTTDNGLGWGEHRWTTKLCPYEECRRVPFVVRYPPRALGPRDEARFALNAELAPTFVELAGAVAGLPAEGRSLVPLLDGSPDVPWRTDILGEHRGIRLPTYALVQDAEWKYVEYWTGDRELYHLPTDPWELDNVAAAPGHAERVAAMAARLRALRPGWPPPGPLPQ